MGLNMPSDPTWWAWAVLAALVISTFFVSVLWWLSGHRGGSQGEPGPVATTIAVGAIIAGIMWWAGWLP